MRLYGSDHSMQLLTLIKIEPHFQIHHVIQREIVLLTFISIYSIVYSVPVINMIIQFSICNFNSSAN